MGERYLMSSLPSMQKVKAFWVKIYEIIRLASIGIPKIWRWTLINFSLGSEKVIIRFLHSRP